MLNPTTCEMISRFFGTDYKLFVFKFTNLRAVGRASSLPTTDLAIQRFQAAVCAHETSWVGRGPLSGGHYALVVPPAHEVNNERLGDFLAEFSFHDPWSADRQVTIVGIGCGVHLDRGGALESLFVEIDGLLQAAERRAGFQDEWSYENNADQWCSSE